MTKYFRLLACFVAFKATAQQALIIPDTLSGTVINLNLHQDSVQFFPGNISYTYGFNSNKFLGPTLIWNKGNPISIQVTNQITDTTTVHWHGIHLPALYDGGPHSPIAPSTAWNPNFTVMDNAATYWYHPHMHGKTAEHVIKGAAGLIIVRDSIESALTLPRKYGIDDFPIIVQCQQWDSNNQVMPLGMQDSIVMINGMRANYGHSIYINAPAQVVRMRLLNASGERTFNFGFTGNLPFYQITSDGGLLNAPYLTTRIRLAPGERAELLLDLNSMFGQSFHLISFGSELPMGVQGGPTMPMPPWSPPMDSPLNGTDFNLMQINVVAATSSPVTTIPVSLTANSPYLESTANTIREIRFTADSSMVMDGPFYFNDSTFNMMRIDYTVPLNSIEIWKLVNETMVAHPFHLHDQQFFILDRNGTPPPPEEAGRKDVVLVLPGDTVRIITKFEDFADTIIPYMYHCHILMHEDDGMMGQFIVHPSPVGSNEITKDDRQLIVYPNPLSGTILNFRWQKQDADIFQISLMDLTGRIVYNLSLKHNSENSFIQLPEIPSGTYILSIQSENSLRRIKLIKQ